MSSLLVLGYGNPTRSDDGVGCRVATILAEEGISSRVAQQLLPEHAAEIAGYQRVIFVDASVEGQPGTWQSTPVHPDSEISNVNALTHSLTPGQLLMLAKTLYGHMPEALLVTVVGLSFEFNETLSPEIEALLPDVIAHIRALYVENIVKSSTTQ